MTERIYPYTAWVLTPSFKPKEVELVRKYPSHSTDYGDLTGEDKFYALGELFSTKRAAIDDGWRRVDKQSADLDKKLESLKKRRDQLRKATVELSS